MDSKEELSPSKKSNSKFQDFSKIFEIANNLESSEFSKLRLYPDRKTRMERDTLNMKSKIEIDENTEPEFSDQFDFSELINILDKEPEKRNHTEIRAIIKYMNQTDLMNKFKKEKDISETSYENLVFNCAANLKVKSILKNEVLFKIDDIGNKFYVILKGCVNVLKSKHIGVLNMTNFEYFNHLIKLKGKDENHLMSLTLKSNQEILPIPNITDFEKILSFIARFRYNEEKDKFSEPSELETFIGRFGLLLSYFQIDYFDLKALYEKEKNRLNNKRRSNIILHTNATWKETVDRKMKIDEEEIKKFTKIYQLIFRDKEKKDFANYGYYSFMHLYPGQFFGDFALDHGDKKRTATIRAEDDCILGFLSNKIYEDYIQQEKKKVKAKEISFLNDNFFFESIKQFYFEKRYFENFALHKYHRGFQLYTEGDSASKLIFIKEGHIELIFNGSLLDLHSLIQLMVTRFLELQKSQSNYMSFINQSDFDFFKDFVSEDIFSNLRNRSKQYIENIYKKRKLQISQIGPKDICGLEEIFLGNLNRFLSAKILTENAKIYKLNVDKLKNVFENEKTCVLPYFKFSFAKIITLLKRLNHIKNTLTEHYMQIDREEQVQSNLNKKLSKESEVKRRKSQSEGVIILNKKMKYVRNRSKINDSLPDLPDKVTSLDFINNIYNLSPFQKPNKDKNQLTSKNEEYDKKLNKREKLKYDAREIKKNSKYLNSFLSKSIYYKMEESSAQLSRQFKSLNNIEENFEKSTPLDDSENNDKNFSNDLAIQFKEFSSPQTTKNHNFNDKVLAIESSSMKQKTIAKINPNEFHSHVPLISNYECKSQTFLTSGISENKKPVHKKQNTYLKCTKLLSVLPNVNNIEINKKSNKKSSKKFRKNSSEDQEKNIIKLINNFSYNIEKENVKYTVRSVKDFYYNNKMKGVRFLMNPRNSFFKKSNQVD
jgi:CRP-like cAMP-binding protein